MRWHRHSQVSAKESVIVQEAQAVLNGSVLMTAYADWQRRPAWAYLNRVAHTDATGLRRLAEKEADLHPATWEYACAVLAGHVLELASMGRPLVDVQRALVPLKVDLLGRANPHDLTPGKIVRLANEALASAGLVPPDN